MRTYTGMHNVGHCFHYEEHATQIKYFHVWLEFLQFKKNVQIKSYKIWAAHSAFDIFDMAKMYLKFSFHTFFQA